MRDPRETARAIRIALAAIDDPELGESIVDLSLIYGIAVRPNGKASILMTTTARFCPAADVLKTAVHACALAVPGITEVEIVMTFDPPWSPEMVSGAATRMF